MRSILWFALTVCAPLAFGQAPLQNVNLKERIPELIEELQPVANTGVAVAVIRGHEILHMEAFGYRDRVENTAVNLDTLFAAASTTKALTGTVIAEQHYQGVLDMTAPVSAAFPRLGFALSDPEVSSQITIEDMLVHRSGLPRHDFLWILTPFPRPNVIRRLQYAGMNIQEGEGFREGFQYNNFMYAVAGLASAEAANKDWEYLVTDRIFKPLGMNRATLFIDEMRMRGNWAKGYYEEDPLRLVDFVQVAPAGALHVSVADMAKWVQMHLRRGLKADGTRFMSVIALEDTYRGRTPMGSDGHYALGWDITEQDGERLLTHGGNSSGVTSQVSFMPELDLGIVVFANQAWTGLPYQLTKSLYQELLSSGDKDADRSAQGMRGFSTKDEMETFLRRTVDLDRFGARPGDGDQPTPPDGEEPEPGLIPCVGHFEHPGYGAMEFVQRDNLSFVHYFGQQFEVVHAIDTTFKLTSTTDIGITPMFDGKYTLDEQGECSQLDIAMEWATPLAVFQRL